MSQSAIAKVESFIIKYQDYAFYALGIFALIIFAFIIWRRRKSYMHAPDWTLRSLFGSAQDSVEFTRECVGEEA